jgi:hypothetical protein
MEMKLIFLADYWSGGFRRKPGDLWRKQERMNNYWEDRVRAFLEPRSILQWK